MSSKRVALRIGGVPEHFNLPWRLLLESGALRRAGIDASWTPFYGGTGEMAAALDDGTVDMAMLLTEGAIKAVATGGRFRLVSWYTTSPLIWGVHVPAHGDIHAEEQIRDRPYAISRLGSGSHLMALVHARDRGWPLDDLTFKKVGSLNGAREALAQQSAQVFFWEKYTTQPFVANGEFRRVADVPTPWPCFVVAVSEDCLARAARECALALRAVQAEAFTLRRRDDAAGLIARRYELSLEGVEQWLARTTYATKVALAREQLDPVADTLLELGLISKAQRARPLIAQLD